MAQSPELDTLEAKVLCHIVEENPSSIKQTTDALVSYTNGNRNVCDIFKKLESDELIENLEERGYYGTFNGVILALLNDADSIRVKELVGLFFEDYDLDLLYFACDITAHPNLSPDILSHINLVSSDLDQGESNIIGIPIQGGKLKDLVGLMKKYPRLYKQVPWLMRKTLDLYERL